MYIYIFGVIIVTQLIRLQQSRTEEPPKPIEEEPKQPEEPSPEPSPEPEPEPEEPEPVPKPVPAPKPVAAPVQPPPEPPRKTEEIKDDDMYSLDDER